MAYDTELAERIRELLASERGAAANTLSAYERDLADLEAHLAGRGCTIADAAADDLRGYYAAPSGRDLPAVLLFQEVFGVNDHIQDVARRLAAARCGARSRRQSVVRGSCAEQDHVGRPHRRQAGEQAGRRSRRTR